MDAGIYKLTRAEYDAIDAVNWSSLKLLASECPANAKRRRELREPPSDSMLLGLAVHTHCLEREHFGERFVVGPKFDRRTKEGKQAAAEFEASCAGKLVLSEDDNATCQAMSRAIQANLACRKLARTPGVVEECMAWVDETTGLACRGLCDKRIGAIALDLKTTKATTDEEFEKEIADFKYAGQAAFYIDGYAANGINIAAWYWLAVNNQPHDKIEGKGLERYVAALRCDSASLEIGKHLYRRLLDQWAEHERTGNWPGYPEHERLVSLPSWVHRRHEQEMRNAV